MCRRQGCSTPWLVTPLRVGDVVHVPADWEDAGRFSPLGDTAADGADVTAKWKRYMDVSYPGRGDGGGGHTGYGDLRRPPL